MNADADRWREWALGTMEYLPWRQLQAELGRPPEETPDTLTDEQLRAFFSFTLGYALASSYREARSQVVRELAGLEPKT